MKFFVIFTFIFALLHIISAEIVSTKYGQVEGYNTGTHQVWKGIPFASAPVGPLRWQPPQAPTPWSEIKNTTTFGNICTQSDNNGAVVGSEDCLFVNVWVPNNINISKSSLPVLVFIYGGSFVSGASNYFEGDYLSGQDLIFVSFNYRVGALGFLYHPALAELNEMKTSGFYGLQDQRFAFEWVQENIANFGGDPNQVTVSGESAGAISLCLHLAAPRSKGLFHQAISQSGFCSTFTNEEGSQIGDYVAAKLDCSGPSIVSCLYSASPSELISVSSPIAVFYPTSHGYEIGDSPISVIQSGNFNSVPILGGTNLNESSYLFCLYAASYTYQQFVDYVNINFVPTSVSQNLTQVLEVYNINNYPTPVSALIAVAADHSFKCFTKSLFQASALLVPSYMYSFNIHPSFSPNKCFGAAHAYDLNFLYPSINTLSGIKLTPQEQVLSQTMRNAWASFVTTGVPVLPNNLKWPIYNSTEDYVILDTTLSYGSHFLDAFCPTWNLTAIHAIGVTLPTAPLSYERNNVPEESSLLATCSLSFSQTNLKSWIDVDGLAYSQYQVILQVGEDEDAYATIIEVDSHGSYFSPWNIDEVPDSSNLYSIPHHQYSYGVLPAGSSVEFTYIIQSHSQADFSVYNNACVPKSCSATAVPSLVKSWSSSLQTSSLTYYSQYILHIHNDSPDTLVSTSITLEFTDGAFIHSSWNLSPSYSFSGVAKQTFTCYVRNLAPGASSSSCGFIISSPSAAGSSPTAILSQNMCL